MTGLIPKGEEPVPATAAPDESGQLLNTLEQEYNISLLPTDLAAIQELGFELLPQDGLAHMSGALQQLPGLLHGRNLQNTYQETYAEAYRLLIPEGCSNDSKMKITKLAEEFGPDAESMEFIGPDGKVKRHGGVQKIDPPDVRAQQIAYLAFSAASVATSQYFLYRIDKKLEAIESTTTKIIQFLETDKKNQLKGNYNTLLDYYSRLRFIMDDDRLRQATLQQVLAVERESRQIIEFYQDDVQQKLASVSEQLKKQVKKVPDLLNAAKLSLSCYWLSIFVYEFAVTLEIILTQNMAGHDFKEIQQHIAEYERVCQSYKEVTHSYGLKKGGSLSDAGLSLALLNVLTAGFPLAIRAALVARNTEALYALPEQMQPGELNRIADSIGELDKLYHGPIELAVSGDQIYFRPLHEADPAAEEDQTS